MVFKSNQVSVVIRKVNANCCSGRIVGLTIFLVLFLSVDSAIEPRSGRRLGRLVNHGRKDRNASMKPIEFDNTPYLCLFAVKDIFPGEEILYDYGIPNLPWEV